MRPGHAADHSHASSAVVVEEYSYTSTDPLGHPGPVTGSLYLNSKHTYFLMYFYTKICLRTQAYIPHLHLY